MGPQVTSVDVPADTGTRRRGGGGRLAGGERKQRRQREWVKVLEEDLESRSESPHPFRAGAALPPSSARPSLSSSSPALRCSLLSPRLPLLRLPSHAPPPCRQVPSTPAPLPSLDPVLTCRYRVGASVLNHDSYTTVAGLFGTREQWIGVVLSISMMD
ncbi:hypothetical protein BS78_06G090900 [Paspalum vaginatum]|nr:hypothetical protein BS78_06G090900 [Paspalum vaginatum]